MRYAKWIVILTLVVVPTLAAAQLPASNQIVADVPFTFMVAGAVIPLGQCIIQRAGTMDQALMVRSPGSRETVFAVASTNDEKRVATAHSLIFHKYGQRYYLAGVKLEGSPTVYSFKPSKYEAELLAQNVHGTEEIVLASLR